MSVRVEHLRLKRLGQKVWQFKDCEPKRVELAVLDYLKSKGWQGYFTEHFDYDNTLLFMMCWCNRDSYFSEKRKTSEIFKQGDPLWYAFNHASDGFFNFKKHKFSHSNIISYVSSFSEDMILRILLKWQEHDLKGPAVGRGYYHPRSASELDPESLISFYQARGGLDYYLDYIKYFYTPELQALKKRARELDKNLKEKYGYDAPLRNLLIENDGNFLAVYKNQPPKSSALNKWIEKISEHQNVEHRDEFIQLAQDIKYYWDGQILKKNCWQISSAKLDLQIWNKSLAQVEVKAPNDRLRPNQKEQLELDASQGKISWVIKVDVA